MKTLYEFYLMLRNSKGATMTEYAIIAAIVIGVALAAFLLLGTQITAAVSNLTSNM